MNTELKTKIPVYNIAKHYDVAVTTIQNIIKTAGVPTRLSIRELNTSIE